ncbi:MAG: SDR family oxidoreductase [Saprospiraceae bacterium]
MKKLFDLKDKTAVVTGGGSGIGEAISIQLARQGARVHILEKNAESGAKVVDLIRNEGGMATCIGTDVTDLEKVLRAVGSIGSPVNILINNAGIAHVGNVESTPPEDFDRIYQVNVKGVYHCLKAVIPMMTGGGTIINVASIASVVGIPDRFAYSMSKGAIYTMTLSVARDYLDKNIRCNCIAPARIHTPFVDGFIGKNYPGREQEMFGKLSKTQPVGRMGTPEEVAALVTYLCSDEAAFITGSCFPIDGGYITLNGD